MKQKITFILCFALLSLFSPLLSQAEGVFSDVQTQHTHFDAIQFVQKEEIVEGYSDGTYKPDVTINRAEFTKIIIESRYGDTTIDNCIRMNFPEVENIIFFPDVVKKDWYAKYICMAKTRGVIDGYPDKTFKPGNYISFVEAAKIIAITYNYDYEESSVWYKPFVEILESKKAIPTSIDALTTKITRGEMAEMVYRLKESVTEKVSKKYTDFAGAEEEIEIVEDEPSTNYSYNEDWEPPAEEDLVDVNSEGFQEYEPEPVTQTSSAGDSIANVDMKIVREAWIGWNNVERAKLGLHAYTYDSRLHESAIEWSKYMADNGSISHKRTGQTAYYDYAMIKNWFLNLGLDFKNVYRVTFTENIGSGGYNCNASDCTDTLIQAIRGTFDFYMGEKDKEYKAHYNSVMNKYFNVIGLGIVVKNGKFFLTVHYGTEIL